MIYQHEIDEWTELSQEDAKSYHTLERIGDPELNKDQCAVLFLKPDRRRLSGTEWKQFQETTVGRCCAYVVRLGSMERSVIVGFENTSDVTLFKLKFVGRTDDNYF
jgi:hypothetical protein